MSTSLAARMAASSRSAPNSSSKAEVPQQTIAQRVAQRNAESQHDASAPPTFTKDMEGRHLPCDPPEAPNVAEASGPLENTNEVQREATHPPCLTALVIVILLALCVGSYVRGSAERSCPELHASPDAAKHPFAGALVSSRRFEGIHAIGNTEYFQAALSTLPADVAVATLPPRQFSDVADLLQALRKHPALDGTGHSSSPQSRCRRSIVWAAESTAQFDRVSAALRELLEDGALHGDAVLPEGWHGVLLLPSPLSRERLTEVWPHRTVHVLHSVRLRAPA